MVRSGKILRTKYISIIAMSKQLKVVIIGAIGVGKSTLVTRLVNDIFRKIYVPTIGVEVVSYQDGNHIYNLWDIAGDSKFMLETDDGYYTNADVIIAVYDISSNVQTQLKQLITKINRVNSISGKIIPTILVGTKSDLFKGKIPAGLTSCSNKTGDGIVALRDKLRSIAV